MKKRTLFYLASAILAAGLVRLAPCATPAATGMLHGTVTDPSGAAIPAASVTVTSNESILHLTTDEAGQYIAANVMPGHYRVEIHAPGFASFQKSGFVISAGRQSEADAQLVITAPKQEITVTD